MSFSLDPAKPIAEELRRAAIEQVERAREELKTEDEDRHEAIHLARKRFKKLRGLLRLARPGLGEDYGIENARWRDAGRRLSVIRDTTAVLETHDTLTSHFGDRLEDGLLYGVRQELDDRRIRMVRKVDDLDARIEESFAVLDEGEKRFAEISFPDDFDTVAAGLSRTYRRMSKAMQAARDSDDPAIFHEWRKRTKYHWVHLKLLKKLWREPMEARRSEAKELADILGDEHDLSVYRALMRDEPKLFGKKKVQEMLLALIDRRQSELRASAFDIGARLCAEKPKALAARLSEYWEVARTEALEPRGKLAPSPTEEPQKESEPETS
ncbi:CHAD domain-containing protein [Afifella sp. IM 167]|uniref:CHAD domain-containing protein n=1 Tax=Afifella sp. IM 167 TaxID=2033586 RepID=UPI001CCFE354|nr:CHAD domain-containing protein [Afifella sp. IM 167]